MHDSLLEIGSSDEIDCRDETEFQIIRINERRGLRRKKKEVVSKDESNLGLHLDSEALSPENVRSDLHHVEHSKREMITHMSNSSTFASIPFQSYDSNFNLFFTNPFLINLL